MSENDKNSECYGLGVYIKNKKDSSAYYAVGGDFGVNFFTAYFPMKKIVATALANTELSNYPLLEAMLSGVDEWYGKTFHPHNHRN